MVVILLVIVYIDWLVRYWCMCICIDARLFSYGLLVWFGTTAWLLVCLLVSWFSVLLCCYFGFDSLDGLLY